MKKIISFITLTTLILTIFTSCALGSGPTLLSFIDPDADVVNLNGKIVTISSESDYRDLLFEQMANTPMYDAIYDRLKEIEKNIIVKSLTLTHQLRI